MGTKQFCVIGFEQKTFGLLWESKNWLPLTHDTSAKLRQRMERKGVGKSGRSYKWVLATIQVGASLVGRSSAGELFLPN